MQRSNNCSKWNSVLYLFQNIIKSEQYAQIALHVRIDQSVSVVSALLMLFNKSNQ